MKKYFYVLLIITVVACTTAPVKKTERDPNQPYGMRFPLPKCVPACEDPPTDKEICAVRTSWCIDSSGFVHGYEAPKEVDTE